MICKPTNPERVKRFRASDETIDRDGEVVLLSAWDMTEFVKNPVIMQFHDYRSWPIGKGTACGCMPDCMCVDCEFDPPEVDESADLVFRKIQHGTVRTGSVGFEPIEYVTPSRESKAAELFERFPSARRIFTRVKLIEFTICPIPANPNAVAMMLGKLYEDRYGAKNVDAAPEKTWEQYARDKRDERDADILRRLEALAEKKA